MATQVEMPFLIRLEHSENIGELAKSLATATGKFKAVKKDSVNPFFKSKYADLAAVIEATYEALAQNGLAAVQSPLTNGDKAGVTTMLIHSSGQWMRGDLLLPVAKGDAQGIGSAITYARRYSLQSFLNVAAEADDDANAAAGKETEAKAATMPRPPKKANGEDNPSTTFSKHFWATAKKNGKTEAQVREFFGSLGFEHTAEVNPEKYAECYAWAEGTR